MPGDGAAEYPAAMKILFKVMFAAAIAGAISALARKMQELEGRATDDIPTLLPVADAEPTSAEPLQSDDLRVAQNAPF